MKGSKDLMEKKENQFKILSILLVIATISIIGFVIVPKYFQKTPEETVEIIDFSSSIWIENILEDQVGFFEKDFFLNSAFSYNPRSNRMIVTYATQKSVSEVRDHYLALPGAEQAGRNDETSLNITAQIEGQDLRIYNYYSPISRVVELELTLDSVSAEQIILQLEDEFPAQELDKIGEIQGFVAGDIFGGYVRYRYDELDEYTYPNIPIFSRAYHHPGVEEDFDSVITALNKEYSNYKYDQTQDTYYYKINNQIISINHFVTDLNEQVVSLSIQIGEN
jgi:hypothetical protein